MKAQDVLDWIVTCIGECEADGYQQQEEDYIHDLGVTYGSVTCNEIWIKVGEEEFRCTVRKLRKG